MVDTTRILVVEDEPDLCEAICSYLALDGYVMNGVGSAKEADAWLSEHETELVILDVGLPDSDGVAWLRTHPRLRGKGLIIATARGELTDRLRGLTAGADAYLVKPVELAELRLVVRNVAQRIARETPEASWRLDLVAWKLANPHGDTVKLTRSEAVLLKELVTQPGATVSRTTLIRALGQDPSLYDPRRMEILIRRLRNKVKTGTGADLPLTTAHGIGYAFTAVAEIASVE